MPTLDRAAILAAKDIPTEVITVPEWGGDVLVKALTSEERDAWENFCAEQRERWGTRIANNIRASLAVRSVVDEEGKRLFTDAEVELIGAKAGSAVDRITDVAMRLSRIGTADLEQLKKS